MARRDAEAELKEGARRALKRFNESYQPFKKDCPDCGEPFEDKNKYYTHVTRGNCKPKERSKAMQLNLFDIYGGKNGTG